MSVEINMRESMCAGGKRKNPPVSKKKINISRACYKPIQCNLLISLPENMVTNSHLQLIVLMLYMSLMV